MMIASGIASGHVLAADWLFLIAAILFALAFIISWLGGTAPARLAPVNLVAAGLALVAFAWLLL